MASFRSSSSSTFLTAPIPSSLFQGIQDQQQLQPSPLQQMCGNEEGPSNAGPALSGDGGRVGGTAASNVAVAVLQVTDA